jgi:hypothetical protein
MAAEIEVSYNEYHNQLKHKLPNVDPDLLLKIMYLERKFPDVEPKADIVITFSDEKDMKMRAYKIQEIFGLSAAVHKNSLIASGRLNVENLFKLASNPNISYIEGNATPASY